MCCLQILFVLISIEYLKLIDSAKDQTLVPDATGCDVAKAAVDKCTTSKIFKKDHNFLLFRVAFTSDFGKNVFVKGGVGIWQLTDANLKQAQKAMTKLQLTKKIQETLCILFEKATKDDMKKPLFSAVAAYLLIESQAKAPPYRFDVDGQLKYWIACIGSADAGAITAKFKEKANVLNDNKGAQGSGCLICNEQPTDLLFILDSSQSISNGEWRQQVDTVKYILDRFADSMSKGASQAAVVVFESSVSKKSGYGPAKNVLNAIAKRSMGGTNMPAALQAAQAIVTSDPKTRIKDQAVKKLVFFLTDGANNGGSLDAIAAKFRANPINIYCIGSKGAVDRSELVKIASRPEYIRVYKGMDEVRKDIPSIIFQTCTIGAKVDLGNDGGTGAKQQEIKINKNLTLKGLTGGQTRYFTFKFIKGTVLNLKFHNQKLTLQVYASFNQQYPSEANYDFKREIKPGDKKPMLIKDPDKFLNDVCKKSNQGLGDSVYVAVVAVGSGTEDVIVELVVKKDEPAKWEDYEDEENTEVMGDAVAKVYNQSMRRAFQTKVEPSNKIFVIHVLIIIKYLLE